MKKPGVCLAVLLSMVIGLPLACAPGMEGSQPAMAPPAEQEIQARPPGQTEWDKTVAAARQEGKVTLYAGGLSLQMRAVLGEIFQRNYGVELEMVSAQSPEVVAKIIAERRAGLYWADVFMAGGPSMITMKENGLIQPLEPFFMLPEVLDKKSWANEEILFLDKERMAMIITQ